MMRLRERASEVIAHTSTGDPANPPVLLLASSPHLWSELAPLLEPWMRVLVPEDSGDARALLDELGLKEFAAVGLGSEGAVALELALEDDLVAKTLVLMGTPEIPGAELSALKEVPAFFLWGEDNDVVPIATAERMAGEMDFATVALIPQCGHNPLESDSATALPLIYEFLRMRYLGRTHGHTADDGPVHIEILTHPPGEPH